MSERLTSREVDFLAMLGTQHTRHTAADAAGIEARAAAGLVQRLGLRFDDRDRLRNPSAVVAALVRVVRGQVPVVQMPPPVRTPAPAALRDAEEVVSLRRALVAALSDVTGTKLPAGVTASEVRSWGQSLGLDHDAIWQRVRLIAAYVAYVGGRPVAANSTVVRAWLREHGIPCPDRGPVSRDLQQQYLDAHPGGES